MRHPAMGLILLLAFSAPAFPAEPEDDAPPFQTTALIQFSGDEDLKEETIQAFAGALASLGDVVLVTEAANWEFRITAVRSDADPAAGPEPVTVSAVLLLPFRREFLRPWVGPLDPGREEAFEEMTSELYRFHGQWLRTFPRPELAGFARNTAADFERRFLKKHREFYEKMVEAGKLTQAGRLDQEDGSRAAE
jgi:hypothetical protein